MNICWRNSDNLMFKTDTEDMYVSMNFSCSWKLEILWGGVVCDYPGAWGHLGVLWLAEEDKLIVMVPLLLLRHLAGLHVGRGGRGATGAAAHHPEAAAQYQAYQVRWPWSLSTIGIVNIFPWYQKFVFDLFMYIPESSGTKLVKSLLQYCVLEKVSGSVSRKRNKF